MILNGQKFLNEKEVASQYDVSLRWVRRIRYSSKDFPYYKLNGRVLYKEDEVDNWLKKNLTAM